MASLMGGLRAQEGAQEIAATLAERRQELAALNEGLNPEGLAPADAERAKQLTAEVQRLERRLVAIVTGVDTSPFYGEPEAAFDLQAEIEGLAKLLIDRVKDATEAPREVARLEQQREAASLRRNQARRALEALDQRLEDPDRPPSDALRAELERALATWRGLLKQSNDAMRDAEVELDLRRQNRQSFWDASTDAIGEFVRSRGLDLLLAVLAFVGVFITLRMLSRSFGRLTDRHRRSLYARAFSVAWQAFTVVAAISALLVVLYLSNDWLLLLLVLLFLAGVGWASIRVLPQVVEEVRIILNLGGVRETERLVYEGVPYEVARLGLYTTLRNPRLSGGELRLPVRDLAALRSRPAALDEAWFPCEQGQWVLLSDGVRGRVRVQSPEFVVLDLPGAGEKSYRTPDFLALAPRNLSAGFRLCVLFGLDYAHQAEITAKIPETIEAVLRERLPEVVAAEHVRQCACSFHSAGASSLDLELLVDVDGAAAVGFKRIEQALSRFAVDACNAHGFGIPFPQLTVHRVG